MSQHIVVKKYSHKYPKMYEEEKVRIESILKDNLVSIYHSGSSSVPNLKSKPIIDISVAVRDLNDILPHIEVLKQNDIIFRGEVIEGEFLFVMGNDEIRTHHIHVVKWNGTKWIDYINFRDFLNTFPEKAMLYDACKRKLAMQFSNDRKSYTAGKEEIIQRLLTEARTWKLSLAGDDF